MHTQTIPWQEPLVPREPAAPVIPEPARRGEEGGEECRICTGHTTEALWSDGTFSLYPPRSCSILGTVWVASTAHVDGFSDLPDKAAAEFGVLCGRVEKAIMARGDAARVHLYRWGDGAAHFHVWFIPRPLGMLEASGPMLPLWEDVMANQPDADLLTAAAEIAARLS